MKLYYSFLVLAIISLTSCNNNTITEEEFLFESTTSVTKMSNPLEKEIFELVNAHRVSMGKNELIFDVNAYNSAAAHNDYMISKGKISHDKFNHRASSLSKKTKAKAISENVAKDYTKAIDAFKGWLSSNSHKEAIEGDYTHTAINVKKDTNGVYYFTQMFFE